MKLKDMDNSMYPRERLIKYGAENLSNNDLLSIIIRSGIKGLNVSEVSSSLINKFGSLDCLCNATYQELISVRGIGSVSAITILASIELGKRISSIDIRNGVLLNNSSVINDCFKKYYKFMMQEMFIAIYLDKKKCLINFNKLFIGTVDSSIVHSREILRYAVKYSACYIVVMHNHPSGNLKPSQEDINFTIRLKNSCDIINIPLIDHIITDGNRFYSFFDNNVVFLSNEL